MKSVLFVCTGNVCRSPMAEGLFRHLAQEEKDVEVASAGISTFNGQPPSRHTLDILRERGIDISRHRSQYLSQAILDRASHIFAMTSDHKEAIEGVYPSAAEKTFLIREFVGSPDDPYSLEVPDPIGLGREAYEETLELIEEALPSVLDFVKSTGQNS